VCFSASVSFGLSATLATIGAVSLARNSSKPQRLFAAIPLVFAAQQAAEGMVWLTIDGSHATLNWLAVRAFLGVALMVWPIWAPLALMLVEQNPVRRRALAALTWAGGAVALCALVLLARFGPVPHVAGHSIRYDYERSNDAASHLFYLFAYVVPTVAPWFVSTRSQSRPLGILLLISLLSSAIVQRDALTSVWCFFAAVLSSLILLVVERHPGAAGSADPRQLSRDAP